MFSRHHLSSRQETSAPAAGCHRGAAEVTALAIPIDLGARRDAGPFLSTVAELTTIPIGRLTSRLTLAGRPPKTTWIKPQEGSATDELR